MTETRLLDVQKRPAEVLQLFNDSSGTKKGDIGGTGINRDFLKEAQPVELGQIGQTFFFQDFPEF